MTAQKQSHKHRAKPAPKPQAEASTKTQTEDLDGLLEEIDTVLEENAEEFVNGYVQKGGE